MIEWWLGLLLLQLGWLGLTFQVAAWYALTGFCFAGLVAIVYHAHRFFSG